MTNTDLRRLRRHSFFHNSSAFQRACITAMIPHSAFFAFCTDVFTSTTVTTTSIYARIFSGTENASVCILRVLKESKGSWSIRTLGSSAWTNYKGYDTGTTGKKIHVDRRNEPRRQIITSASTSTYSTRIVIAIPTTSLVFQSCDTPTSKSQRASQIHLPSPKFLAPITSQPRYTNGFIELPSQPRTSHFRNPSFYKNPSLVTGIGKLAGVLISCSVHETRDNVVFIEGC